MARYSLNLPSNLKKEAEDWAERQNISLNQFIMWAVAEKVGALKENLNDQDFPNIAYRRGAASIPTPVIRGTGIRVQTIVVARGQWEMDEEQIASEYDLDLDSVNQALAFYQKHQEEIDRQIAAEKGLELQYA